MSLPLSPTCSKHSAMVSVKTSSPACCLLTFCLCTMSYCYCWMCLFHPLVVHGLIKRSYCVFLPEIIHLCYIWTVESILHKRLEDWCTFLRNRNKPLHDSRYLIVATFVSFPEKAQKCSYVPFHLLSLSSNSNHSSSSNSSSPPCISCNSRSSVSWTSWRNSWKRGHAFCKLTLRRNSRSCTTLRRSFILLTYR